MGLIASVMSSASGVLADQWREYFYCDALDADTLVVKGQHSKGGRSTNSKGSDNIISNGSVIAVNEGQCMIIVDQGEIAEVCAQAGEFTYDTSKEPSIFYGGLGQGILESFKVFGRRVGFGGDTGRDQRVYYFNIKDIIGNKYGTANPVPFRVVDTNIGLDTDISIKCFGEYAYKIEDPILFYKNICGNVTEDYTRDKLDSQLKSELLTALQPAFAKISEQGIRYSALPGHTDDLAKALNEILSETWGKKYGIVITAFGVSSVKANEEDEKRIKELQMNATMRDPGMAAAQLAGATAQAMQSAAANENAGPMMAFAGMNLAGAAGGNAAGNLQGLYAAAGQQQPQGGAAPQMQAPVAWKCAKCGAEGNTGNFCGGCGSPKPVAWKCPKCGAEGNTGNFCGSCGTAKPEGWTCACGAENTGNFCSNCGKAKP
ncbi:MAG: SPFH domain-containing protein [Selenomonadaceae bacterium]|nr:SPFH domain-containing protein [Selenomonadaceae bacterium]